MGYRYRSSAVPAAGGDPRPLPPAQLTGQPGSRAPHLPVTVDHRQISTLDLYGRGFVLLAGVDGAGWTTAAASLQVPVAAYRFGVELTPADGVPPTGSGPGSPAGPARRLRRLAQHRPAPRPTTELGGVLRAILSTPR